MFSTRNRARQSPQRLSRLLPDRNRHFCDHTSRRSAIEPAGGSFCRAKFATDESGASLTVNVDQPNDPLAERVVESRVIHEGHYLTFRIDTIERADGSRATREVAGHPGAVAVVAIDDEDRVLLVRQWRSSAG